jgi:hypothetical protein
MLTTRPPKPLRSYNLYAVSNHENVISLHITPEGNNALRLYRLCWFGHVQRMEENRSPKILLCMNLELTRPRGRQELDGKMK